MAPISDVKFLVLSRDLVSTVWSHPQWDGGIVNHAKTLVTFLQWLSETLADMPCTSWKSVRYESLIKAAEVRTEVIWKRKKKISGLQMERFGSI